eukprot:826083-Ditylum_brightwellii.AAC.1
MRMDFVEMELWYLSNIRKDIADNVVGVIQANAIGANNNSGTKVPLDITFRACVVKMVVKALADSIKQSPVSTCHQ